MDHFYNFDHIYTGFNDDVIELYVHTPELDDEAAMQQAWEQWCAQHPEYDYGEPF